SKLVSIASSSKSSLMIVKRASKVRSTLVELYAIRAGLGSIAICSLKGQAVSRDQLGSLRGLKRATAVNNLILIDPNAPCTTTRFCGQFDQPCSWLTPNRLAHINAFSIGVQERTINHQFLWPISRFNPDHNLARMESVIDFFHLNPHQYLPLQFICTV